MLRRSVALRVAGCAVAALVVAHLVAPAVAAGANSKEPVSPAIVPVLPHRWTDAVERMAGGVGGKAAFVVAFSDEERDEHMGRVLQRVASEFREPLRPVVFAWAPEATPASEDTPDVPAILFLAPPVPGGAAVQFDSYEELDGDDLAVALEDDWRRVADAVEEWLDDRLDEHCARKACELEDEKLRKLQRALVEAVNATDAEAPAEKPAKKSYKRRKAPEPKPTPPQGRFNIPGVREL